MPSALNRNSELSLPPMPLRSAIESELLVFLALLELDDLDDTAFDLLRPPPPANVLSADTRSEGSVYKNISKFE